MTHVKRMFIVSLVLIIVSSALAACSSSNNSGETANSKTSTNSSNSQETATESAKTRKYTTLQGEEIEIPTKPERVITGLYLGELLALGVKPVGAVAQFGMDSPWFTEEQISGIEDIGSPVSLEKVTELNPDLIIASSQEEYDQLSKIAPTVLIPFNSYGDVYAEMRALGDLVGKREEAEKWIEKL